MSYSINREEKERKDRQKSLIITLFFSIATLIALYFYKFSRWIPAEQLVTTMLINFGDEQNGDGLEEPANQEGSALAMENPLEINEAPENTSTPVEQQKVLLGTSTTSSASKIENKKSTVKPITPTKSPTKKSSTSTKSAASTSANKGDAKGTAAIGNLIRGRGKATGSQGTQGSTGNQGDPLGGSSSGDSKIGVDRKLISFIPGTMGRGGAQPSHSCAASGTITIAYTVNKSGDVTSARRSSGISDPCISSTSVDWVKKYVKAEASSTSSTGTYRITF